MHIRARTITLATFVAVVAVASFACAGGDDEDSAPTVVVPPTAAPVSPVSRPTLAVPTADPSRAPGPASTIELRAEPSQLVCDGQTPSVVTALVLDSAGQPVEDGTEVRFDVVAIGSADPITADTDGGIATTDVTAFGEGVGVAVNVSSGDAAAALRIDCE